MAIPTTGPLADPEFRRARAAMGGRARLTPEYHVEKIRELVDRTRTEQGLPAHVTDELTLAKVADILRLRPTEADLEAVGS